MSMCGELENLEREIMMKKTELEALQKRHDELQRLIDEDRQPMLDMHLDPDRRNWEYDGYGEKRNKTYFQKVHK